MGTKSGWILQEMAFVSVVDDILRVLIVSKPYFLKHRGTEDTEGRFGFIR